MLLRGIPISSFDVATLPGADDEVDDPVLIAQDLSLTIPNLRRFSVDCDVGTVDLSKLSTNIADLRLAGYLEFTGESPMLPALKYLELYNGSEYGPSGDGAWKILRKAPVLDVLDCNCWWAYGPDEEESKGVDEFGHEWNLTELLPSVSWMYVDGIIPGSVPRLTHLCIQHEGDDGRDLDTEFKNLMPFVEACPRLVHVCLFEGLYRKLLFPDMAIDEYVEKTVTRQFGGRKVAFVCEGSPGDIMTPKRYAA
jgi:hypothetical protein